MSAHSFATLPIRQPGTCIPSLPCINEVQAHKILVTKNMQLVILPTLHLKNEIKPDYKLITFVNLRNDQLQLTKHIPIESI